MPTPRFWLALETFPSLAAPAAEWRIHLGAEWTRTEPLLMRTGEIAEIMLVDGQPHRIVSHASGRVVAVPEEGGVVTCTTDEDVQILRVDGRAMERLVTGALAIEPAEGSGMNTVRQFLGRRRITQATSCRVHLCIHCDPAGTCAAILRLLAGTDEPLIILTPCRIEDEDIRHIVRLRSSALLALEDAIDMDNDGLASLTPEAARVIDQFARIVGKWESDDAPSDAYRFQRIGRVWVIAFKGRFCYIPHSEASGLAYLQHLLARPGKILPVTHLEQMVEGQLPLDTVSIGEEVIDRDALRDYEDDYRRMASELERARAGNNGADEARLISEMSQLLAAINSSRGLNGRVRRQGDDVERLRTKVTKAIDRAVDALRSEGSPVVEHLESSISTGRNMAYCPVREPDWAFA